MSEPSIFTKIINGELPSHKVYEDEQTLAFLNIYAVVRGHVLVVPKVQVEFVWDLAPSDYAALMNSVKKVALRLREVLAAQYVGEQIVGVDVPHTHVHLIPFDEIETMRRAGIDNAEPDHEALALLAKQLYFK